MADDDGKIKIGIKLNNSEVKRSYKEIESDGLRTGKSVANHMELNIGSSFKKLALLATAAFGLSKIKSFIGESVKAASTQEAAVNRLNTSLMLTGKYSESASNGMTQYASALQETSKYDDDVILKGAALIQTLGNLTTDGLKRATKASIELAAATGKDLNTAFEVVAKAASGNISMLSRYIGKIDPAIIKNNDFTATLGLLERKFAGSALSATNNYDGASTQLANTWGDMKESVGAYITRNDAAVGSMKYATKYINDSVIPSIGSMQADFNSLSKTLLFFAISFGQALTLPLKLFEIVANSLNTFISTLKYSITSFFSQIYEWSAKITATFGGVASGMTNKYRQEATEWRNIAKEAFGEMNEGMKNVYSTPISENLNARLQEYGDFVAGYKVSSQNFVNINDQATKAASEKWISFGKVSKEVLKEIDGMLKATMVAGMSKSIQKMTQNLAEGKNIFSGFRSFVMDLLGDMFIKIGEAAIAGSAAIAAIGKLNPAAGLAAGLTLIAIGSIMKSFMGSGGGTASSSSSGGGGGTDTTTSYGTDVSEEDFEEKRATSSIKIDVHGSMYGLDAKDTADHITRIIKDNIDDGTILRGAFA